VSEKTGHIGAVAPATELSVTVRLRADQSVAHLRGAALFAGECRPLEEEYTWPAASEVLLRHGAFASAAVMLAVAAVEAFANELYADALVGFSSSVPDIRRYSQSIPVVWDTVERAPLVRKLDWMLQMVRVDPLPSAVDPAQSVTLLIRLRNCLVHYKTEWTDDALQSERLESQLLGRFPNNTLSTAGQQYFPYRCLGYGAGCWAVETVLAYVRAYCARLAVPFRFEPVEEEIRGLLARE
jgi:hypothetical protein